MLHEVPFINASAVVFEGLRGLLDDQVAPKRRAAALVRLRKYAGVEPGTRPFTELLKARAREQMAKAGVIYPARDQMLTELGRNGNYVSGIHDLFNKYHLSGWETDFVILKSELTEYDRWVSETIVPHARPDFRMTAERYALALEGYGVDIAPAQIAADAHAAFDEYQTEMAALAKQVAEKNGYASNDYRSVIGELKKKQITGDAILPFYEGRLHEIERLIAANNLVTLPSRPAIIRIATAAETAQQPAPAHDPAAVPAQHRSAR